MKYSREFTTAELCDWMRQKFAFADFYMTAFYERHIDGNSFVNLNNNKLREMGILLVGHRLKILGKLRKLR